MAIDLSRFHGKKFAVMGLGKSGLACALMLRRAGAHVTAWDDAEAARLKAQGDGLPTVDLSVLPDPDFNAFSTLVLAPGIPHTHPEPHPIAARAKAAGIEIIGDVEILRRADPETPLIGITGTNGKSTTTALIAHILDGSRRVLCGGNLGTPVAGFLDRDPSARDLYVLELSSYQLELTPSLNADVAVFLNLSPDHLDRHGGMDGYFAAKKRIFARTDDKPQDAVIGVDDRTGKDLADVLEKAGKGRVIRIASGGSEPDGIYIHKGRLIDAIDGRVTEIGDLNEAAALPGTHNMQNAAAAFAACRAIGLHAEEIFPKLLNFPGLAHRQQLIGEIDGIRFVNDSKATNADAAVKALSSYPAIYWIAGGRAKDGGLGGIEPALAHIKAAFLIGEAEAEFAAWLDQREIANTRCATLPAAIKAAFKAAKQGEADKPVILLSPACASFDQYPNFEARGDAFVDAFNALKASEGAA